jgi:hypothetical protein
MMSIANGAASHEQIHLERYRNLHSPDNYSRDYDRRDDTVSVDYEGEMSAARLVGLMYQEKGADINRLIREGIEGYYSKMREMPTHVHVGTMHDNIEDFAGIEVVKTKLIPYAGWALVGRMKVEGD